MVKIKQTYPIMPPKSTKSRAAIKAEITDKVREIRLRQQKWMEQRESSMSATPTRENSVTAKANKSPPTSLKLKVNTPKQPLFDAQNGLAKYGFEATAANNYDSAVHTKDSPKEANAGFHSWLSARQNSKDDPCVDVSDVSTVSKHSNLPEALPPLNLPSSRSTVSNVTSAASELQSISERTLPPEQFDTLADQIVNRVKRELHLANQHKDTSVKDKDGIEAAHSIPQEAQNIEQEARQTMPNITSHSCPVCGDLMLGQTHRPLLLIPCGHTACSSCSSATCPLCQIKVLSATPNIMLQQIISDYHGHSNESHDQGKGQKKVEILPTRSQRVQSTTPDSQRNQLGKTYSQMPTTRTVEPPKKSAKEYEEEYRNLLLRCDVLHEEEESICEKMVMFDHQKQGELDQIDNITGAQERIRKEIEAMEAKIIDLESHKDSYRGKCDEIDSQRNKERRKLEMVRTTVVQLKKEIKKIKTMLEEQW